METRDLQLLSLETRTRKLERWLQLSICGWLLIFGMVVSAWTWQSKTEPSSQPSSLRVSELVVVDPKGVERVRIGGDLPDPNKKTPRGQKAAGVLLYDGNGTERSGYVTFEPSGNVGLTLDTRRQQVAYFVAAPDGGAALKIWRDKDSIELRSDEDGPRLTSLKSGQMVLQEPAASMSPGTCAEFKAARARVPREKVMSACQEHFSKSACLACLGGQ